MIECAELADEEQGSVRESEPVAGDVGEMLHLAYDVITEIPDEPAVQRGEAFDQRTTESSEQFVESGEDALVQNGMHTVRKFQISRDTYFETATDDRHEWPTAYERITPPPIAALDRLEEEPWFFRDHLRKSPDRGNRVGHQLSPYRHDCALAGDLVKHPAPV
jgi:hypothetical protein